MKQYNLKLQKLINQSQALLNTITDNCDVLIKLKADLLSEALELDIFSNDLPSYISTPSQFEVYKFGYISSQYQSLLGSL